RFAAGMVRHPCWPLDSNFRPAAATRRSGCQIHVATQLPRWYAQDMVVNAKPAKEIDVSIVICTRNRASRLSGTLGALRALRTCHSYEVIWVDNASTDDTAAVLRSGLADDALARYVVCERI